MKTQQNNTRRNHYITYKGETKTLKQWSETLSISYVALRDRLGKHHWSIEKAFESK